MNAHWWIPDRPDTLYATLAGGLIGLFTALFTNRFAVNRQKNELAHQAKEREKERHHALKREVYLPLLETVQTAVSFVARVPTMPFEKLTCENPMDELAKQIAKLNLIAPPEVVEPVARGHAGLAKTFMTVTFERLAIQKLAADLAATDKSIENYLDQQKATNARFERREEQGTVNKSFAEALANYHARLGGEILKQNARRQVLLKQKSEMELSLNLHAVQEIRALRVHGATALLAIRRDLGTPIDAKTWTELMDSTNADIDSALNKFYKDIERRNEEFFANVQTPAPTPEAPPATEGQQPPKPSAP